MKLGDMQEELATMWGWMRSKFPDFLGPSSGTGGITGTSGNSKMTSHDSGASSAASGGRGRGRCVGVPKRCSCGEGIVARISKSDSNPYRRYYRCGFAVEQKLVNDNHTFKWVDEALLNEIEASKFRIDRLEEAVKPIATDRMEVEKQMYEKFELKLEKEIVERVEERVLEAKSEMKKLMLLVCFGCVIILGCSKLV
ncbi:uncharacterized protein At4g04775-like [Eutrema salsugineum]|uniref:uncharacterized protein At4g04775-like n=1 Tax=Eutrema salsugineum TaxID=72664 RepID=UPI000CED7414|nr:uncharacterized protein At4g04775-like [Eutrema salsugineum]